MERPLRTAFTTSRGSKKSHRFVLVRVRLAGGPVGIGEVPTSFTYPHESMEAILHTLATARPALLGLPIDDALALLPGLRRRCPRMRMTLSGLEVAMLRAKLAARGSDEFLHWGGRCRRIETDITIPFSTDAGTVLRWLAWAGRKGFRIYKVKVSGRQADDRRLLTLVAQRLADTVEGCSLLLDGNQGFTPRCLLALTDWLASRRFPVALVEQPLRKGDWSGLQQLRGRCPLPIVLDESVQGIDHLRRVIDHRAADGVNIKIAKSGLAESAEMVRLARRAKLLLMIGCMTETAVGLSAGINFAAGTGEFDYVDLDSIHFFSHNGRVGPWRIDGPRYVLEGRR
jgi:L-alanine-DL-glutamate epimerase-like enolase superfamily enzyme